MWGIVGQVKKSELVNKTENLQWALRKKLFDLCFLKKHFGCFMGNAERARCSSKEVLRKLLCGPGEQ